MFVPQKIQQQKVIENVVDEIPDKLDKLLLDCDIDCAQLLCSKFRIQFVSESEYRAP